jgi:signal transduction histidine kinase
MSNVTFLLVDDLERNLLALEGLLRREGLDFLKARSGPEALELLLVHDVALAIVDVQMPGMDGFELAELMRGTERTRRVPIIFVTAGGVDTHRPFRGYEIGAVDFLFKPIDPDILRSKAAVFFELYRQRQEISRQRDELSVVAEENTRLLDETRRQAEALRRSRDELEIRVRERTAELERRNRELQEFAFVASHDLSEPLRKIQTFGSLLEAKGSSRLTEVEKDYIARMTGAANRMQELLDALLTYPRLGTRGQEFRPTRLDVAARDAAGDLEVFVREAGARVEIEPLPTVNGDPNQLRQLFQNLIANAVKYGRSEVRPLVRIRGGAQDRTARLLVEDNGIGFDEEYLDKIFQPFQRLHGKNEYSGTGIGLAVCKKIVERHGGTITARSTPGKGSTFIIELPCTNTS